MTEWKIFSNSINGATKYIVGRIIDKSKVTHSGNIKYAPGFEYTDNQQLAEKYSHELNALEGLDRKEQPPCPS